MPSSGCWSGVFETTTALEDAQRALQRSQLRFVASLSRHLSEQYVRHHQKEGRYGFIYVGRDRSALFRELIGEGKLVLDLGCRDGSLTHAISRGNEIVGVDIDPIALRLAADRLPTLQLVRADLNLSIPFRSGCFDVVVAGEVLEHILFPHAFSAEIKRVLKPNGLFVGSTPNVTHVRNRLRFLIGGLPDSAADETHLHYFSPASLTEFLSTDFSSVRVIGVGTKRVFGTIARRMPALALDLCWSCRVADQSVRD